LYVPAITGPAAVVQFETHSWQTTLGARERAAETRIPSARPRVFPTHDSTST